MPRTRRKTRAGASEPPQWTIDGEFRLLNEAPGGSQQPPTGLAKHFVLAESRNLRASKGSRPVNAVGWTMASGGLFGDLHHHRAAHLFYMVRGELTCEAAGAWWLVPPESALWIPGSVPHRIRARAPLEGYNVFLDPDVTRRMPTECGAVSVSPLLREVILRLAKKPVQYDVDGPAAHLVSVLLDELTMVSPEKLRLPMPTDERLQRLVTLMTSSPADDADVKTWAKRVGLAERTLNRLLVRETGLSFVRWRQQLHIVLAIQSLSRGASVHAVATDLGYENASSFVTMFRRTMGAPPGKYAQGRRAQA